MMSNKHAEELCAMMDGELGQSEARFLLKRLGHEEQLTARWKRYHYSRAVLRGENPGHQVRLYDRISVAISQEPVPTTERGSAILPAWLRPVAGFAVAASVAVAAFTIMQTEEIQPVSDQAMKTANISGAEKLPSMSLRAQPASAGSMPYQSRLQAYVTRHNAFASPRRGRDLGPYIYLITAPASDATRDTDPDTETVKNPQEQPATGVSE